MNLTVMCQQVECLFENDFQFLILCSARRSIYSDVLSLSGKNTRFPFMTHWKTHSQSSPFTLKYFPARVTKETLVGTSHLVFSNWCPGIVIYSLGMRRTKNTKKCTMNPFLPVVHREGEYHALVSVYKKLWDLFPSPHFFITHKSSNSCTAFAFILQMWN